MKKAVARLLAAGLEELVEECQKIGRFFLPREIFLALQRLVRWPAVELVIVQNVKILLVWRAKDEPYYAGCWTLPGGFVEWNESLKDACARVAKREIKTKIRGLRKLGFEEWTSHEYGRPISFFYFCFPEGKIKETTTVRFFSIDELPDSLPALQKTFASNYLGAKGDQLN